MKEILKGNIQVIEKIDDWKEAIRISAQPILKKQYIQSSYIESAIQNIEELGPYIILVDGVAIPHSRPEEGVFSTSSSLLIIKNGISFSPKTEDVKLIFFLAAKDNSDHMDLLKRLSGLLLDNEQLLDQLLLCSSSEEVLKLL